MSGYKGLNYGRFETNILAELDEWQAGWPSMPRLAVDPRAGNAKCLGNFSNSQKSFEVGGQSS